MSLTVTTHAPSKVPPPSPEDLDRLTAGNRLAIAAALDEAARRGLRPDGSREASLIGPKTDEELLDAVYELTGYHIPRVAVCTEHDHSAPSQTFCDLYFERVHNCLWIGNRGGGKTANSGILHGAKNRYLPGYSSAIAGAVERQGYRAYAEFKRFTRHLGTEILKSMLSKTTWANASETEVLGGTVKQLNGPHPNLAQMDEVELTQQLIFEEFLNMAQGNERYDGQQLLTSTRKIAHGIVQDIVRECQSAEKQGEEPPWEVRIFCVFETMARVPNCRAAPKKERRALLKELGLNQNSLCNCDRIKKGVMEDGTDRTFEKVCHGRAFRSDGFVHLRDVQKRFKQLSVFTWEAQQECLTPELMGLVHPWLKSQHFLYTWFPHQMFGPIYRGWDWGGRNPHAVVWCQYLTNAVGLTDDGLPVLSDEGEDPVTVLPAGTLVQFDELYKTSDELPGDGGFSDLAEAVANREVEWRGFGFDMVINGDFCDPAGFVAKREVRKKYRELIERGKHPGLEPITFQSFPAGVPESVRLHISWGEGQRIRVVPSMCQRTLDEYDVYHWPDKKPNRNIDESPVDEDNHAMDAKRYLIWGLDRRMDRAGMQGETPKGEESATTGSPVGSTKTKSAFAGPQTVPGTTSLNESPIGTDKGRLREKAVPALRQLARPGYRR